MVKVKGSLVASRDSEMLANTLDVLAVHVTSSVGIMKGASIILTESAQNKVLF